jgi:hypothetical protein
MKSIFSIILASFLYYSAVATSSKLSNPITNMKSKVEKKSLFGALPDIPDGLKLVIGAGGIYGAFLYYGTLQEDVFHYKSQDGSMFKAAWFLQALGNLIL